MDIFIAVITTLTIVIAFIAILNSIFFPRLPERPNISRFPFISILIPARNESNIITDTAMSWQTVNYPNIEILFLDDCSSDGTTELIQKATKGDSRLRVLHGESLPSGWTGKNWACHQLSKAARGELFLFTDADVRWESDSLAAVIAEMNRSGADLLTIWPKQVTKTWAERLVVPLLGFSIISYLPVWAVHNLPWQVLSGAIGQGMVFRRSAYEKIGGHQNIKTTLLDDMELARAIKRARLRLRFVDSGGMVSTRMYHNWCEVRDGFAKNILGGHRNCLLLLVLSAMFHWAVFIVPWIWLLIEPVRGIILITLGILIRTLSAAVTRQRILDAVFLPISVLLMTAIAARAIYWHFNGGLTWKGRRYEL